MSFPRYPKYKDSGVEWLGEVPEHWRTERLKRRCEVFPSNVDKKSIEGQSPVLLCNYTDVYYNDVIAAGMDFMPATATEEQIAKFTLRGGDTIITKDSETADDIAVAAYVPNDLDGVICGYHLSMIRPRDGIAGAFVKRLFDSNYARSSFAVRANGLTRVGLPQYAIDNIVMPFPPLAEQHAIATFLDRETAKIDALIAEQQRLIELLQEKRQAVISHAVTKGLNPDAPMKDSGIEWLGEVPEHWTLPPLYARYEQVLGKMLDQSKQTGQNPMPYLRNVDVQWDSINTIELPQIDIGSDEVERFSVRDGDVLVCEGGEVGRTAIWAGENNTFAFQKAIHRLRPLNKDECTRYFFYIMRFAAGLEVFVANCNPNTIPHLTGEQLRKYRFPKPSLEEQILISAYLDEESARFDKLINEARNAIALLQERRSALISAAVTGQIDVRGLAPKEAA
jgi:type I restriction enzyme S subunit